MASEEQKEQWKKDADQLKKDLDQRQKQIQTRKVPIQFSSRKKTKKQAAPTLPALVTTMFCTHDFACSGNNIARFNYIQVDSLCV